ncbi:MAG: response regulator transcription factor [Oscillochloridaceae bacterium]|nr:response regulator transcription factor [Chloroflexaceae bacterium]MDW8388775.1 response regulator transcription factor [Oscillochloridaceae bacterium]
MTTVFIVAPTPALRAGLQAMLTDEGLEVTGTAPAPSPGILADVVLVAGEDPGAVARAIASEEGAALVALSADARLPGLLRALPLPGWAIVAPDASPEELRAAVHAAAQGLVALPRPMLEHLAGSRVAAEPPVESLTPRETEVLTLLSEGLPNKQIALRLQISEHTVKFHIASIFAKLGATSRTEAVSIGARQGLITL